METSDRKRLPIVVWWLKDNCVKVSYAMASILPLVAGLFRLFFYYTLALDFGR